MYGNGEAALGFLFIIVVLVLFFLIFYLISLQKTLSRCSPECRTMEPNQVWLMLIPLFNIIWQFIMVRRIPTSIENELTKRGDKKDLNSLKNLGIIYCILELCAWMPDLAGELLGVAGFICWILYWIQINQYSKRLLITTTTN